MAGDGKIFDSMKRKIRDAKMNENIILLGYVDDIFNLLSTINANINISLLVISQDASLLHLGV